MIDLAKRGLGTVLQTQLGVQAEIARGELVFIPLSDSRLSARRLSLIARPKGEASEAAEALGSSLGLALERLT